MYTVFEQVKIGSESGARIFSQSQSIAMQHQSNCKITLGTKLKTALTDKDLYNKIIKYSMLTVYIYISGGVGKGDNLQNLEYSKLPDELLKAISIQFIIFIFLILTLNNRDTVIFRT